MREGERRNKKTAGRQLRRKVNEKERKNVRERVWGIIRDKTVNKSCPKEKEKEATRETKIKRKVLREKKQENELGKE